MLYVLRKCYRVFINFDPHLGYFLPCTFRDKVDEFLWRDQVFFTKDLILASKLA